jgi:hypothetical protein
MPQFRTGTDDFQELIEDGGYFVDKSPLIRNVIEGSKVTLLPRPRRFGKTLNMTMLRYFFEQSDVDRRGLFEGLAITADAACMAHQGKYPVIYLSLKDVKGNDWAEARAQLAAKLAALTRQFADLTDSLAPVELRAFQALDDASANDAVMKLSLKNLITWLHAHYGQPVVVLIDEYDSPVIEAWNKGYYEEMIDFMRSWLGGGLKHENARALYRAVVTGILRVARESVFSGLNNLDVASLLRAGPYADKFGFTQPEVDQVLQDFALPELAEPMQVWYNGYDFGGHTIYNPWSVIQCISGHPNPIGPQWLNTASNDLIYAELEAGGLELKRDLETLMAGEELRYPITEHTTFSQLGRDPQTIGSFLVVSGYLKASDPQEDLLTGLPRYLLSIPNREVHQVYREFVRHWHRQLDFRSTDSLLRSLAVGNIAEFEILLAELCCNLFSVHDVARYPEAAYHAFMLGLLANLRQVYEIRSNVEAGYGRGDILLRPKTDAYPLAFIIEFKSIAPDADSAKARDEAFAQIAERNYEAQLLEAGVAPEQIHKLAIIFSGKRVTVTRG